MNPLPHRQIRLRNLVLRIVFCCLVACSVCRGWADTEGAQAKTMQLKVVEGKASVTLPEAARQAGVDIVFSGRLVRKTNTPAIEGSLSAQGAFDLMLEGTPLVVVKHKKSGVYTVRKDKSKEGSSGGLNAAKRDRALGSEGEGFSVVRDVYELSPFSATVGLSEGYRASTSLAGTRLNTDFAEIAASISVVTRQFLEDTGSNRIEDLLIYTVGTEVTGPSGNMTAQNESTIGQNRFISGVGARREKNERTRLRGLQSADQTRSYFSTSLPMDTYNTERVVINRGANAILYGLGSAAGVINQALISPSHHGNFGDLTLKLDSFGSVRREFDYNSSLRGDTLAIRVAGLDSDKSYEQEEAFIDDRRLFLTASYKPLANATFRASFETADIEGRRPSTLLPSETIGYWIESGKPVHENQVVDRRDLFEHHGSAVIGPFGPFFANPGVVFGDPNGSEVTMAGFPGLVDRQPARGDRDDFNQLYGGIRDWASFQSSEGNPIGSLLYNQSNTDRTFFDYRSHLMEGPNGGYERNFDVFSASFEYLMLEGNAGLELAVDRQNSDYSSRLPISGRDAGTIAVDINTHTLDGRSNPNFGRPYVVGTSSTDNSKEDRSVFRATAFYRIDFEDKRDDALGRALGVQTLTGLFEKRSVGRWGYRSRDTLSAAYNEAVGRKGIGASQISSIYYLGPSIFDATSTIGLGIPGVRAEHPIPQKVSEHFFNRDTLAWEQRVFETYDKDEWGKAAVNANLDRFDVRSSALILQSEWLGGSLSSIMGYRDDKIFNENVDASLNDGFRVLDDLYLGNPSASITELNPTIFTYGGVLHLSELINKKLPGGAEVSFGYNESENTTVARSRFDLFGKPRKPASGLSRDYSITVTALNNRLSAKLAWYETSTIDNTLPGIPWHLLMNLEDRITQNNTAAEIESAGYKLYGSPGFDERLGEHFDSLNYQRGELLDSGLRSEGTWSAIAGTKEVDDLASEGLELEMVYNPSDRLRFLFNLAKQESVRAKSGTQTVELIEIYEGLLTGPAGDLKSRPIDQIARDFLELDIKVPTLTVVNQDGSPATEIVEWRANWVGAYQFSDEGPLSGWGIGGAVRYQSGIALGFPVVEHEDFGIIEDVKNPWWGDDAYNGDLWINKEFPVMKGEADFKVQLNIRNLIGEDLILHRVNAVEVGNLSDYAPATYRTSERTRYELTATLSF